MVFCLYLRCLAQYLFFYRLSWCFVHFLHMVRMELALFVELFKCQLLLSRFGLTDKFKVLLFVFLSVLLLYFLEVVMNSLILLNIHLIHLWLSFFLLCFNFIHNPEILFHELLVSDFLHLFLLWLSLEILLDLLFVFIDQIGMNGLGHFLLIVFDVLMILVHFVDVLKLLFF